MIILKPDVIINSKNENNVDWKQDHFQFGYQSIRLINLSSLWFRYNHIDMIIVININLFNFKHTRW